MFLEGGVPVRATLTCSFKEWRTNYDNLNKQAPESADVTKIWLLKRDDSLSHIAAENYRDPSFWRHIAAANNIDNPLDLKPGRVLTVPNVDAPRTSPKRTSPPVTDRDNFDTLAPEFPLRSMAPK